MILKVIFWCFFVIIFYAYIGYPFIIFFLACIKKLLFPERIYFDSTFEPQVSMIIPAYNEADYIEAKVKNCRELDYPEDKLQIIWVNDGSTDGSQNILKKYNDFMVLHEDIRKGKIHAINRCMSIVKTPIVVFTDANSMLNTKAIREIVGFFADQKVGCVAGEKRIAGGGRQKAVSAGEGLYWRYESTIKSFESDTGSVLGAVGELFAIRRSHYKEVREDTLLDDFTISMQISSEGCRIRYAPGAWSLESASFSIPEELKRKIRIATGAIQFLHRNPALLNPLRYGLLAFKYVSHKVLRWTLVPLGFIMILICNLAVVILPEYRTPLFQWMLLIQLVFYLTVTAGALLKNVTLKRTFIFIPYYLFIMNYAILAGIFRYLGGKYSTSWPKAKRS